MHTSAYAPYNITKKLMTNVNLLKYTENIYIYKCTTRHDIFGEPYVKERQGRGKDVRQRSCQYQQWQWTSAARERTQVT